MEVSAHHMSFPVHDLTRARSFYEGVLGLQQIPRPEFPVPGVWYRAGACEVHLIEIPGGLDVGEAPPALNPMARHAAFAVRDYAETLAHLKRHGLEVLETSAQQGQLWVRDPDGHIIELIIDTGVAPQVT
jgi:catechol 2,3-dioxygenase-like lactoylglutathione lyase family enzyme